MSRWPAMTAALAVLFFLSSAGIVPAAEVKVLSSTGVRGVLNELATKFEAATGHKVVPGYDVFAVLKRRIDAGEGFDVAILSPGLIDGLAKQGKIVADTVATVGRTGMGAAVPAGAPKPDIGSVEAFEHALRDARSVGYPKEDASGAHFLALLDRLGLA